MSFLRFENSVQFSNEDEYRIVLLGCEKSGKSTIFQQIPLVEKTYTDDERLIFKENISNMIMERLLEQLRNMKNSGVQLLEKTTQEKSEEFEASLLKNGKGHDQLFKLASIIKLLWNDQNLQNYLNDVRNNVDKSAECFLNKLDKISLENYIPSDNDISNYLIYNIDPMKSKKPIEEMKFVTCGVTRNITVINHELIPDREVIELLNKSKGVIFCVSLADYDVVSEDGMNEIVKAKNSFSSVLTMLNSHKCPVLLLFTKTDLFAEKLNTVPIGNLFPHYKGGNSYEQSYEFILNIFHQDPLIKRWERNGALTNMLICTFNREGIRGILWWAKFEDITSNETLVVQTQ